MSNVILKSNVYLLSNNILKIVNFLAAGQIW